MKKKYVKPDIKVKVVKPVVFMCGSFDDRKPKCPHRDGHHHHHHNDTKEYYGGFEYDEDQDVNKFGNYGY